MAEIYEGEKILAGVQERGFSENLNMNVSESLLIQKWFSVGLLIDTL